MKQLYAALLLFIGITGFSQSKVNVDIDKQNTIIESKLNAQAAEALQEAMKSEAQAQKVHYTSGRNKALALIGVAFYKIDKYDSARNYINQAIELAKEHKDSINLAYATYWKGNLQLFRGAYSKALDLYQATDNIAVATGDKQNWVRAIDGKASIYEALSENDRAKELYNKALETAKVIGFTEWLPPVTFSLANIAYKEGNIESAIRQFNEAIALSDKTNNQNNKGNCLQQLAAIYYAKNDSKQAMEYIRQAMDIFKETGSASSYSFSSLMMATILLKDKEWDLSIELAQKALQAGKKKRETLLQRDAAELLYYAYRSKGETDQALNYHVLFHQLSETGHREDLTKKLTQMELETNFAQEREVEKAQQEKVNTAMQAKIDREKLVRKMTAIGLIFLALIAGVAIFAFLQKRKDTQLIALEKRRSDEILRSIIPHELVGKAQEQSRRSSSNLRTILFAVLKESSDSTALPESEKKQLCGKLKAVFAKHGLEQVHTEGDIIVGICQKGASAKHMAENAVRSGIEMLELAKNYKSECQTKGTNYVEIDLGIHTGAIVAGIIGVKTSDSDIWGDVIENAVKVEQHGMKGRVNISSATYDLVKEDFKCVLYGNVPIADQGELGMYLIDLS